MIKASDIDALNLKFQDASPEVLLAWFAETYGNRVALSSSLSLEDQVLTHMVMQIDPPMTIFTLDTGRLFPETYDLMASTSARYKTKIKVYFPDHQEVEEMVNAKGINLFYDSVENRKQCCNLRKVKPLQRAFKTLDAWVCGLRREQSVTRTNLRLIEWDADNGLIKVNPLINWTEQQVKDFVKEHSVPYNTLHDKGFPSIGCQPCTRAILPGEDLRSGRWWWEHPESRECGLHKK